MNIDGNTRVVGIVANPISHVRTPQLFNACAARQGLNVVCVPFHVMENEIPEFLSGLKNLRNLTGLIVTIPHKESVLKLCGRLDETAHVVGSVNAMRYEAESGHWIGENFDGRGFVAGLREQGHSLRGKRVLLLGTGGAGKSIAYAVAIEHPAELALHNRSQERAIALGDRLRLELPEVAITIGSDDAREFDVVINATSLGLNDDDPLPLRVETLQPGTLVCEAVMNEGDTRLLVEARKRGCVVHHGEHMLQGQIVEIARFMGIEFDTQTMKYMI